MDYMYNAPKNKKRAWKTALIVVIVIIITNAVTFGSTMLYLKSNSVLIDPDDKLAVDYVNKLVYLKNRLKDQFLWEVDEEQLWVSAVKGLMSGTGDVYTSYMTKEEYAAYEESGSGSFEGIGVQIINNDIGNIQITKVFPDSPALKSGLLVGDQIISADGTSLIGQSTEYGVTLIKGKKGTTVTIGILREGEVEVLYFDIVRATISNRFITSKMLDGEIGYIAVSEFGEGTAKDFRTALKNLTEKGMKGLILDLRQNPGGRVSDALEVADEFLEGGTEIIYTLDNKGHKTSERAVSGASDVKLVVLADENSASASEIVAGSLQDNNRAKIIGTKTFGKGIIQMLVPLSDGSLYKVTYEEYYVPSGAKIHGIGITPDVEVKQAEEYKNKIIEIIPNDKDLQLQKAISVLEDEMK